MAHNFWHCVTSVKNTGFIALKQWITPHGFRICNFFQIWNRKKYLIRLHFSRCIHSWTHWCLANSYFVNGDGRGASFSEQAPTSNSKRGRHNPSKAPSGGHGQPRLLTVGWRTSTQREWMWQLRRLQDGSNTHLVEEHDRGGEGTQTRCAGGSWAVQVTVWGDLQRRLPQPGANNSSSLATIIPVQWASLSSRGSF